MKKIKSFKGKVIHWKKLGRVIWFPTANLKIKNNLIDSGTYKINIVHKSKLYNWAWVAKDELFEAHIFDFDEEIYGDILEIIILKKIRENKKFNSLEDLKKQIKKDIIKIKKEEIIVMSFGTFDILHPWHKYFLNEAKKYSDKFVIIIARDKNVEKLKAKTPKNNELKRLSNVKKLWIWDEVLLWDEKNPLKWIDFYKPKIIALGYDQVWFSDFLKDYKEISIIRIWSFKEDIYKSSKLRKD